MADSAQPFSLQIWVEKHTRPNKVSLEFTRIWLIQLNLSPLQIWVENTIDPTSSEEEHEDVFENAALEFTRIWLIQLNPSPFRFG